MFDYIDNPRFSREEWEDTKAFFGIDRWDEPRTLRDEIENIIEGDYDVISAYILRYIMTVSKRYREEFIEKVKSDDPERTVEFIFGESMENHEHKWKKRQTGRIIMSNYDPELLKKLISKKNSFGKTFVTKEDSSWYKCYVDDSHNPPYDAFISHSMVSKAIDYIVNPLSYSRYNILLPKFNRNKFCSDEEYKNEILSEPIYVRFDESADPDSIRDRYSINDAMKMMHDQINEDEIFDYVDQTYNELCNSSTQNKVEDTDPISSSFDNLFDKYYDKHKESLGIDMMNEISEIHNKLVDMNNRLDKIEENMLSAKLKSSWL